MSDADAGPPGRAAWAVSSAPLAAGLAFAPTGINRRFGEQPGCGLDVPSSFWEDNPDDRLSRTPAPA